MSEEHTAELKEQFYRCMPLFIALGDENRLSIIEALTEEACRTCCGDYSPENLSLHGMSVGKITEKTRLSRPAISHHLKILKNAGLVAVRRVGTSNYYCLSFLKGTGEFMKLERKLEDVFGTDFSGKA